MTGPNDEHRATISFCGEAHDSAAEAFRRLEGLTVTVEPAEGEDFDGTIVDVQVSDDGMYVVNVAEWIDGDITASGPIRTLDIYSDIRGVVVL